MYICVGLLTQFRGVPRGWGASYEKKQRGCPTLLKKFKLYAEKFCLYNTVANTHLLGGTPFRKNYAGIGFTYDADKDAFIPPKPFASWVLDDTTCQWKAPIDVTDDSENSYYWVETLYQSDNTKGWVKVDKS